MKNNVIAGFIVNLLQDINILRPLIYLAADDIGLKPIIFVTDYFVKRDKSKMWLKELESEDSQPGEVLMYTISNCTESIKAKKLMAKYNISAEIYDLDKMPSYGEIQVEATTP